MVKRVFLAGFFFFFVLLGVAVTGGAFYRFVLPRFDQPLPPPKPKPKKLNPKFHAISPEKDTFVPQIAALPGTTILRVAHQTSNAHQAWALANMGKVTDPGSIFARHGITMQFRHLDQARDRIAELQAMAAAFNRGDSTADVGAHFEAVKS